MINKEQDKQLLQTKKSLKYGNHFHYGQNNALNPALKLKTPIFYNESYIAESHGDNTAIHQYMPLNILKMYIQNEHINTITFCGKNDLVY